MSSKVVLFCTQTATVIGGVATWLEQLCTRLRRQAWRPVVGLAHGSRAHDPERYRRAYPQLETIVLDGTLGSRESRVRAVVGAIARVRADVVVPLSIADAFDAAARGKLTRCNVRLMAAAHGPSPRMLCDIADFQPFCDMAVAVSRLTAYLLVHGAGIDPVRVRHVPNGVRPRVVPRAPRARDSAFRVGYVGRLDDDKRASDLIGFCDQMDRLATAYTLAIVGGGTNDAAIRAALTPRVASGTVKFCGALSHEDVFRTIYPGLDCLVQFSGSEGFPVAPLEAMAHGVIPVVANYSGCAAEAVVRDGETALLFEVGDLAAAATLVARLNSDSRLADRLSAGGVAEAATLSLDAMATQWHYALDETMSLPPLCGPTSPWARVPSGHVDRWLTPNVGDWVRRLIGRRFVHKGTEEWPFAGPENPALIARFERLAAAFEATGGGAHIRHIEVPCAG